MKYATDPDYRLNQKESTDTWLEAQGGAAEYHREYRRKKRSALEVKAKAVSVADECELPPDASVEYGGGFDCERGNLGDESHFARVDSGFDSSANSDACFSEKVIKSGIYRIFPAGANRDAFLAEIHVIVDK